MNGDSKYWEGIRQVLIKALNKLKIEFIKNYKINTRKICIRRSWFQK